MLQGFISKLLRRNRDIGQTYQWRLGSWRSLNTARDDKLFIQMVKDYRFIPAARLCMEMIRRFLRRLLVWSMVNRLLAAGYQFRRPARCPRLTVDHRQCRHVWGRTHRIWNLRHWRQCVFSEESRSTQFHSDGCARVHCRQGERPIEACIQPLDGNHRPSVMVWSVIHHYAKF